VILSVQRTRTFLCSFKEWKTNHETFCNFKSLQLQIKIQFDICDLLTPMISLMNLTDIQRFCLSRLWIFCTVSTFRPVDGLSLRSSFSNDFLQSEVKHIFDTLASWVITREKKSILCISCIPPKALSLSSFRIFPSFVFSFFYFRYIFLLLPFLKCE